MHNQFDDFICYVCQSLGLIRYLLRNGPYFQIEYLQKYSPFPITQLNGWSPVKAKMVKFCKHLFFFCRFASLVHVHSAQTGTGVLIDVLEIRENIAFGDKLCEMA